MSFNELVAFIVAHHDSRYLVPLSQRYPVQTWNRAMRAAWQRMGLI